MKHLHFKIFYYGSTGKEMNEIYRREFLFKMSQGLIFCILAYMQEKQVVLPA